MIGQKKKNSHVVMQGEDRQIHSYDEFAGLYDDFMDHVPFEDWALYLLSVASQYFGRIPERVCDLGCGTGEVLYHLRPHVKKICGLDASENMLGVARKKLPGVSFFRGNLSGPLPFKSNQMPWFTCTHDTLNYLTDENDMRSHFREVNRVLCPGGLYSADVVTLQNILRHFAGKTETHSVRGRRIKWSNQYNRTSKIMESRLEFYSKKNGILVENHLQRYYTLSEIKNIAADSGLVFYRANGDYSDKSIRSGNLLINLHFIKPRDSQND